MRPLAVSRLPVAEAPVMAEARRPSAARTDVARLRALARDPGIEVPVQGGGPAEQGENRIPARTLRAIVQPTIAID